jgi:hypothetical protein
MAALGHRMAVISSVDPPHNLLEMNDTQTPDCNSTWMLSE